MEDKKINWLSATKSSLSATNPRYLLLNKTLYSIVAGGVSNRSMRNILLFDDLANVNIVPANWHVQHFSLIG